MPILAPDPANRVPAEGSVRLEFPNAGATPTTDESYQNAVQDRATVLKNWTYLQQNPGEASKHGIAPEMVDPNAAKEKEATPAEDEGDESQFGHAKEVLTGLSDYMDKNPLQKVEQNDTPETLAEKRRANAEVMAKGINGVMPATIEGGDIEGLWGGIGGLIKKIFGEGGQAAASDEGQKLRFVEKINAGDSSPITLGKESEVGTVMDEAPADETVKSLQSLVSPEALAQQARRPAPGQGMPAEQMADLASKIDPDFLKGRFTSGGVAPLGEESLKLKEMATETGNNVRTAAQAIMDEPDPAKQAQMFQSELAPHLLSFGEMAKIGEGATAESGRALAALNESASGANGARQDLQNTLQGLMERPEDMMTWVRALASTKTPEQAAEIASQGVRENGGGLLERGSKAILRYAVNAALMNPQLLARKAANDAMMDMSIPLCYRLQEAVGARPAGTGLAVFRAMMQGHQEGFEAMSRAWEEAKPVWSVKNNPGAFGTEFGEALEGTGSGKALDYTGHMSDGRRAVMAMGEYQNAITYRMHLSAEAWTAAANEAEGAIGRGAIDASERMQRTLDTYNSHMAHPYDSLHKAALASSKVSSFINDPGPVAEAGHGVMNALDRLPGNVPIGRLAMLFYRTPVNLYKAGVNYSPLGFVGSELGNITGRSTAEEVSAARARAAVGSAITAMAMYGHHMGVVTGNGPADPELRKTWLNTHQPYSIKVDGHWISYAGVPFLHTSIGSAADAGDIYAHMASHDTGHLLQMLGEVAGRNVVHAPFMDTLTTVGKHIMDAAHQQHYSTSKDEQLAQGWSAESGQYLSHLLVPAVVGQTAKAVDPVERQLKSFMDAWKDTIPGMSSSLHPYRNAFGEPHYIAGGYTQDDAPGFWMRANNLLGPAPVGKTLSEHDPVWSEAERMGIAPARPSQNYKGYQLSADQYDRLQVLAGEGKYDALEKLVESDQYKAASDGMKKMLFVAINKAYNRIGTAKLLGEDKTIIPNMVKSKVAHATAMGGAPSVATP